MSYRYKETIVYLQPQDADIVEWYCSFSKPAYANETIKKLIKRVDSSMPIISAYQLTDNSVTTLDDESWKCIRLRLTEEYDIILKNIQENLAGTTTKKSLTKGEIIKAIIRESIQYPRDKAMYKYVTNPACAEYIEQRCNMQVMTAISNKKNGIFYGMPEPHQGIITNPYENKTEESRIENTPDKPNETEGKKHEAESRVSIDNALREIREESKNESRELKIVNSEKSEYQEDLSRKFKGGLMM